MEGFPDYPYPIMTEECVNDDFGDEKKNSLIE